MNSRTALNAIGQLDDADIALTNAALWLSVWMAPGLKADAYQRHLQTLVREAQLYVGNDQEDPAIAVEATRQILARRYGYALIMDDTERGPGATLSRVIDTRRGGAYALCMLYAHVLAHLGLRPEILAFAPRALLGVMVGRERLILDPSDALKPLEAPDLRRLLSEHRGRPAALPPGAGLERMSNRAVLVALQHDVMNHHLRHAAPEAALAALEAGLMIAPEDANLWREAGLLHARLDHIGAAISAFEHFLSLPGDDTQRYRASQMLQQLKDREDKNRP